MVNCEKCRNYETEKCIYCEHFDRDLDDYYEPDEELAQREEELQKAQLEACVVGTMETDVPAELADTIARLTQFTDRKHFRFPAVYCGQDELIATDGVTLVRVRQHVPAQLIDKYVLETGPGTVKLAKHYPDNIIPKCHEFLNIGKSNTKFVVKYDEIFNKASLGWGHIELTFADLTIAFDKDRLLKALSLLDGCQSIKVYWPAENIQAVLFEAGNTEVEVLVMPVRTRS
ncbi:hypothetical protein Tfer_0842 [Thermincola ferriacetica]|uniref:Uncharacterized protein n=1 Tax=Thermincola ferriacetica TaxID=281456 RepID=A0A0L6W3X3_9FIRM|nr:hypothetical protein [Thermincola ferriacetica]KNZ70282.1 hypothetical protein Tfer_0842 [Thermincola ferriacetica]